jgi:hypothetical protein
MKPEEIKIGGVYDVRLKVMKKLPSPTLGKLEIGAYTLDRATNLPMESEMSWFYSEEASAFAEINSENDRKNSEPAPKYDPCRLFKKGDRVRVVEYKGRIKPYLKDVLGKVYTLDAGENDIHIAYIKADGIDLLDVCHLELVSPVEELDPYEVTESPDYFAVAHRCTGDEPATFWKEYHPNPAAAAEAECKRLNDEHRKETEQ